MNSSGETLLQEEEEEDAERKRLRYPIGLESSQEASALGQRIRPQTTHTPNTSFTNPPIEVISDDDASNFILLINLKTPIKKLDQSVQEPTNLKEEILEKTNQS